MFNNIGNLCQRAGRYDESLKHYRNALSIYREIGDRRCEADALNNIGAAFHHAGHHGEALEPSSEGPRPRPRTRRALPGSQIPLQYR